MRWRYMVISFAVDEGDRSCDLSGAVEDDVVCDVRAERYRRTTRVMYARYLVMYH